jgi:hypothetical protein
MAELLPGEIEDILKAAAAVKEAGGSAKDFAAVLANSAERLKTGSGSMFDAFSLGTGKIYGGVESFTKSMANGTQGAAAFGGVITGTAAGLGDFTKFLGKLGPVGEAVTKTLGGVASFSADYVVRALKQSDDLFNTFQNLSKVGGAGAEGMTGVFNNMQKLGMTMNQLPEFTALISKNSEALAVMGGTVAEGTKKFAGVAGGIEQSGLQAQFERMGITVQAQNEGIANYLKLQTLTGINAQKSEKEQTAAAAEYIAQQDRLSRLTGKSADALAKESEARQSNERYAAVTLELQMKAAALRAAGDEEGAKAAEQQFEQNEERLKRAPASMKQGMMDLMSGFANSPEAQKIMISLPQTAQDLMAQQTKTGEEFENSMTAMSAEAKGAAERNIGLAKAGVYNKVGADFAGLIATGKMPTGAAAKTAKSEQDTLGAGGQVDVNNQVALREAQRSTTTAMDNLTKLGVGPLTAAMTTAATEINKGVIKVLGPGIAGERTALTREPTADEKERGINPNRGKEFPATAGYESNIDTKKLSKAWDDFTKNIMLAADEVPVKPKKVTPGPTAITPAPAPAPRPSPVAPAPAPVAPVAPVPAPVAPVAPAPAPVAPAPAPVAPAPAPVAPRPGPRPGPSRGAGPAYQAPRVLEDNRPENQTSTKSVAEDSAAELVGVISEGIKVLSRGQADQQQTMSELVELMRRSVGVQGKILQTSR